MRFVHPMLSVPTTIRLRLDGINGVHIAILYHNRQCCSFHSKSRTSLTLNVVFKLHTNAHRCKLTVVFKNTVAKKTLIIMLPLSFYISNSNAVQTVQNHYKNVKFL